MLSLIFILRFHSLYGAVIKHDISSAKIKEFDYSDVCESMGSKNSILISPKSLIEIECLNKSYSLIDFCSQKFPLEKTLTRGFFDLKKKKVICEMSESVMLSLSCDKVDLKYCFNPKKGCDELRKIYAYRLVIAHYSMLAKNLNCYYSKHIEENLNEM